MHSKEEVEAWANSALTRELLVRFGEAIPEFSGTKPDSVEAAAIDLIFVQGMVFARNYLVNIVRDMVNEREEN